jgi:hypothetical protein
MFNHSGQQKKLNEVESKQQQQQTAKESLRYELRKRKRREN